jgi:hypothetical protein
MGTYNWITCTQLLLRSTCIVACWKAGNLLYPTVPIRSPVANSNIELATRH